MMQLYRMERRQNNFWKYLLVIILTVFATLFTDRTIQKANEMDDFAQKLSEENNNIKTIEQVEYKAEDYVEDVLKSTVGISFLKPNGANILDVNIEQKWGIGTGIIVSEKGYILTNQHLAKEVGARLNVTLNSRKISNRKSFMDRRKHRSCNTKNR